MYRSVPTPSVKPIGEWGGFLEPGDRVQVRQDGVVTVDRVHANATLTGFVRFVWLECSGFVPSGWCCKVSE